MSSPAYLGLARKYRPQGFGEVVGQSAVSTTLKNAVSDGRPSHAYLFFGPRGVGKTTTARILAKALNCEKGPSPEPCGRCAACREIAQGASIDVLELDAATHTQVDKIREMIVETASLAPSRDRYKIFIIDEVHMLSTASFNALLKTLEEPPAHVVFILATTDPGKIPATIVSRCQRFRFRPLPAKALAEHLRRLAESEKITIDAAALELLAKAAGGSLRDAVGLLEQAAAFAGGKINHAKARELLGALPEDLLLGLGSALLAKDASALGSALEDASEQGYDPAHVLRDMRERLHAAHLFRLGVGGDLEEPWRKLADGQSPDTFSFLVQQLGRAMDNIRQSDSPRLSLEISLFGMLDAAYDLGEWLARLEALESRLSGGAAPPKPDSARPAATSPGAPKTPARPAPGGDDARNTRPLPATGSGITPAASGARGGDAWLRALADIRAEKPGLAHDLEGSRVVASEGEWRLVFSSAFVMERAQKNLPLIEAKLASAASRPVRVRLEAEGKGSSATAENPPAPAEPPVEDPTVKKVLEVFPGKVRFMKKP